MVQYWQDKTISFLFMVTSEHIVADTTTSSCQCRFPKMRPMLKRWPQNVNSYTQKMSSLTFSCNIINSYKNKTKINMQEGDWMQYLHISTTFLLGIHKGTLGFLGLPETTWVYFRCYVLTVCFWAGSIVFYQLDFAFL